jgi:hypothetical protein
MKIVERREHGGIWWGGTPDGSWFRWSTATTGWEGPLPPPWPVISAVMEPSDVFTPGLILTDALAAVFTATLLALRTSVWGLALFSSVGGLLGGFAMVLVTVMTFSDPGGVDFLLGWRSAPPCCSCSRSRCGNVRATSRPEASASRRGS